MADEARLTTGSISGHLVKQTAPIILGVAAIMSVGIIDAYFVGQLGEEPLAAISFIFPVTTALSSLGVGIIAGVSSVVSRALGEGDTDKAKRRGNLGVVLGLAVGLVVAGLLYLLRGPLFELMQANEATLPLIDSYMVIYALGFPLLVTMMGMNGVLRGQGAAKRATAILLSFSVANWILDPLLINGGFGIEGMGIAGAAWATVIGWGIGLAVAFGCMQSSQIPVEPSRLNSCKLGTASWSLARVAGPAAFSNSINPIGLSVLTAFLAAEGQDAVAGYGAGGRLQTFAVVPLLALSSSIGAIVGQNWGAGQEDRARAALVQAGLFCIGYGLLAGLALFMFRDFFAGMFSESEAVREQTARYLELAVWGYAGYGVLIVVNGALNAIDRATTALLLSGGRVLLVMVPFAALLQPTMGADAIYLAELACNIAGALAACAILYFLFKMRPSNVSQAAAT
ncbi:Multidrug export protein MepA [Paraurantiacibacter namhicola]|uniref:Multidrug export protein MepA n=2 Tax=Paraurantiacibacter namhicola TaxID=645517 RepID=A0A1C7DB95_9SPHN|nr:MATE family efflux transporter [Paraurantiacibacter namhicola]ANU08759.1 Multidrug export protein MepA [Paraurantiacibacter namhicola]